MVDQYQQRFGSSFANGGQQQYGNGVNGNGHQSSSNNYYGNGGMSHNNYNSGFGGRNSFDKSKPQFKLQKNFYIEDPEIAKATPEQVKEFRLRNNNIMVFPSKPDTKVPNPCVTFEQAFRCDPEICKAIHKQNFAQPTPIQCQNWPINLSGYDSISISQTGSGKTLGFLLPGFVHVFKQTDPLLQDPKLPGILVVCPTRELAIQTHNEVLKYKYRGYETACVYGGAPKNSQLSALRRGAKIVVGTPGRINDLIQQGHLIVNRVTYLVLDEADRMLDMGFEPQIRAILNELPEERQNVMTSATWPKEAKELAQQYLNDPIQINIGEIELHAADTISQNFHFDLNDPYQKDQYLLNLIQSEQLFNEKVLVFANTKIGATNLCHFLSRNRILTDTIHGNLDQYMRERALNKFRRNEVRVLTATDVAARGLDISDINCVINYDCPKNSDEYVHRIGRTGRAGKPGTAHTFMSHDDAAIAKKLLPVLKKAKQTIPPPFYDLIEKAPSSGGGRYGSRSSFRNPNSSFNSGGGFNRFGSNRGGDRFGSGGGYHGGFKREKNDYNRY